jgi:peptide/nickel transport system ATP-binding protein
MKKSEHPLLTIENLTISFHSQGETVHAVKDVSFTLARGETLGIVGESGSGKSLTSLAIMGLLPKAADVKGKEMRFTSDETDVDLLTLDSAAYRKLRGNKISMIFQEPMTSLNPVHTCGAQVSEALKLHLGIGEKEARKRVEELFAEVELPDPNRIYDSYPHQLSGGQKQRVMIAMAMCCEPDLVIADEPTTALDVTVQGRILELLKEMCVKNNAGLIFITHDLGVVSEISDQVMVMYRGEVLEKGSCKQILRSPEEQYTKALIACRPRLDAKPHRLKVVSDFTTPKEAHSPVSARDEAPAVDRKRDVKTLLKVEDLSVWYPSKKSFFGKPLEFVKAVDGVSFNIFRGETLGLVGESGCGKSTLGRAILRLTPVHSGRVLYEGVDLLSETKSNFTTRRRHMQLIFQDPYASLNPRFTVEETLIEPMLVHGVESSKISRLKRINEILDRVGLPGSALSKYPHEFSGGQRQRVCIARALVTEPEFIICDESVSALDVSVQAQVLNLLNDLKDDLGLTYIFVSHDLSVVKYMSDKLVVMKKGKIEEQGPAEEIYKNPQSPYTRKLIDSIPVFAG